MNKKDKLAFKKRLLEKKETLARKLSEVYTESKEVEINVAQDVADKAESSYTKEFLLNLSAGERKLLSQINEALRRIESCEYGTCQMCRKDISRKRIEAVPWTPFCINCQEKAEEESV